MSAERYLGWGGGTVLVFKRSGFKTCLNTGPRIITRITRNCIILVLYESLPIYVSESKTSS